MHTEEGFPPPVDWNSNKHITFQVKHLPSNQSPHDIRNSNPQGFTSSQSHSKSEAMGGTILHGIFSHTGQMPRCVVQCNAKHDETVIENIFLFLLFAIESELYANSV